MLDRAGLALTLALPLFLMHGRGIAEALLICSAYCSWRAAS